MNTLKNSPLISVIIPIYNVEKYLKRCLESVLNQNYRNIEVICIDDGSTDGSLALLESYAKKDERIYAISQKNSGVSAARNAGLNVAKGEWIAFVDSDDEVMPDIWDTLLADVDDEDAIYFSAEEISLTGNTPKIITSGYFDVKFSGRKILQDDDLFNLSVTMWDKLFRRAKVEEYSLRFPEGVCFEDNVFFWNFVIVNRKALFVPKKLYRYFRRDGSITDSARRHKEGIAFDCIKILDYIFNFWKQNTIITKKQYLFERICVNKLREAIDICLPWERVGISYALAEKLNHWKIIPLHNELTALREGNVSIRLGKFPGKNITMLKPLRGWQKIFYIGNYQGKKILCLFGFKVACWRN